MIEFEEFESLEDAIDSVERNLSINVDTSYDNLVVLKRCLGKKERFMLFTMPGCPFYASDVQDDDEALIELDDEALRGWDGDWPRNGNREYEAFFINPNGDVEPIINSSPNRWEEEAW
jgi:hypothetical protein